MRDLAIRLENRLGALAEMGETLGNAGVSVEGGGGFVFEGKGIAHFLFEDGDAARKALEDKGIEVLAMRAKFSHHWIAIYNCVLTHSQRYFSVHLESNITPSSFVRTEGA